MPSDQTPVEGLEARIATLEHEKAELVAVNRVLTETIRKLLARTDRLREDAHLVVDASNYAVALQTQKQKSS